LNNTKTLIITVLTRYLMKLSNSLLTGGALRLIYTTGMMVSNQETTFSDHS